MSETMHYLWIVKNKSRSEIDGYLNTLVGVGIDCFAEGSMVYVHPDQWDKAVDALREAEYESMKISV